MCSLTFGGRLVVIGDVVPEKVSLNLGYLVTKCIRIFGSSGANQTDMGELLRSQAERPFEVHVQPWELAQADAAQRRLQAGGIRGRPVLVPPPTR